jgi:hypothetical protein
MKHEVTKSLGNQEPARPLEDEDICELYPNNLGPHVPIQ